MRSRPGRLYRPNLFAILAVITIVAAIAASAVAQAVISEWGVPTANSQPSMITTDSSGNAWITETAGNKIARVNPNGVFQEYDVVTANSQPWGIFVEPSGRVWYTEAVGNKLGNILPSGQSGQDNIPTDNSQPRGLVVDSSTNVWFTESNGNKIGKMTQYGQFTEFPVPTNNSQPWAIALDASGNIWFTERTGNKIARMTQQGSFVEFQVPTSSSTPTGIAIDGSGNIWFTEYDGNKIGMMTQQGVFTEYNIPTGGAKPYWITIDRAGSIWYTGSGNNSFGRASGGGITEFGLPSSNSAPLGIVADASGNVWMTEQQGNRVAKAVNFAPIPTATPVPPTATPIPVAPTPVPVPHDNRYFGQTGYRIDNDVFWDYFNRRGGIRTFGYPVSRTFQFLGFTTQFYQRTIMQLGPDGSARTMNILDPGLMPYTKINGSTFPAPDPTIAAIAPAPGTPGYDVAVLNFVRNYSPNQFEGMNVNFYQTFVNTVTLQDAFPLGGVDAGILPLLNLEMWGVPTSRPMRDPNNFNFVYLRFQRGIMHYDATNGVTQGLLLADYLKGIITGQNLPSDLDSQANGSQFYKQYNPNKTYWVDRPDQLPGTNLAYAFERQ